MCVALIQGLWAARIWRLRLVGERPFLFAYLISTLGLAVLSFLTRWYFVDSGPYRLFWSWTQPLFWTLTLLVLVETYNHVLGRLRGFHSVGQLFLRAASVGVGGLYVWMTFSGSPASWFDFWLAHRLGLFVAAATFFFLIAAFAKVLQTPFSRNDHLIILVFGLLVGGGAVALTLREVWGNKVYGVAAIVMPLINLFTSAYAARRFSVDGEIVLLPNEGEADDEAEMLENLEAMNRTLGKTRRR